MNQLASVIAKIRKLQYDFLQLTAYMKNVRLKLQFGVRNRSCLNLKSATACEKQLRFEFPQPTAATCEQTKEVYKKTTT